MFYTETPHLPQQSVHSHPSLLLFFIRGSIYGREGTHGFVHYGMHLEIRSGMCQAFRSIKGVRKSFRVTDGTQIDTDGLLMVPFTPFV